MADKGLTNMELSKTEAKTMIGMSPDEGKGPTYPYGLEISLSEKEIEKLGLPDLKVGDKCEMLAQMEVKEVSAHAMQDKTHQNIRFQITACEIVEEGEQEPDLKKALAGR